MERELRKTASERRGMVEAADSVRELTRLASRYAAEEKRSTLRLNDMQKAVQARFCQIWPFCKSLENYGR